MFSLRLSEAARQAYLQSQPLPLKAWIWPYFWGDSPSAYKVLEQGADGAMMPLVDALAVQADDLLPLKRKDPHAQCRSLLRRRRLFQYTPLAAGALVDLPLAT